MKIDPDRTSCISYENFCDYRSHIAERIKISEIKKQPFHHLYIKKIFPPELYSEIKQKMLDHKYSGKLQERKQDSKKFVNNRYSLVNDEALATNYIRALFSDNLIKKTLLSKFYASTTETFVDSLIIHDEFEFMYTKAGRMQDIHVDIPPKFLSFVFYIPEEKVEEHLKTPNATIVYDEALNPHYSAKYSNNSVCIFAPHLTSYHGFAATINREVFIMFFIQEAEQLKWIKLRKEGGDKPPFKMVKDTIYQKMKKYKLIEFNDVVKLNKAYRECKINAPQGRVFKELGDRH